MWHTEPQKYHPRMLYSTPLQFTASTVLATWRQTSLSQVSTPSVCNKASFYTPFAISFTLIHTYIHVYLFITPVNIETNIWTISCGIFERYFEIGSQVSNRIDKVVQLNIMLQDAWPEHSNSIHLPSVCRKNISLWQYAGLNSKPSLSCMTTYG